METSLSTSESSVSNETLQKADTICDNFFGKRNAVSKFAENRDLQLVTVTNDSKATDKLLPLSRDLINVSFTVSIRFTDKFGSVQRVRKTSQCSELANPFDAPDVARLMERVVVALTQMIDPFRRERRFSVMVGIQVFNESTDRFLQKPLFDASMINAKQFSAFEFLS